MRDKISIVSNIWIRQIELQCVGDSYGGHSHTFDHQHLLAVGSIEATIGDRKRIFHAPQMILIEKDTEHKFVALTQNTLGFCIHPIRNGHRIEDIVSEDMHISLKDFNARNNDFTNLIYAKGMNLHDAESTPATPWDIDEKELKDSNS